MENKSTKACAWLKLGLAIFLFWIFATVIGPWGETHIPVFSTIVELVEARDIDSGAYFYTEINASYRGEKELLGSLKLKSPDQAGITLFFISGILTSLLILIFGFFYLPTK